MPQEVWKPNSATEVYHPPSAIAVDDNVDNKSSNNEPTPGFLSRLVESGKGLVKGLPQLTADVLSGPVPVAQRFARDLTGQMLTSDHPIRTGLTGLGETATGLPLRQISTDISNKNYPAAAGDMALPAMIMAGMGIAGKRLSPIGSELSIVNEEPKALVEQPVTNNEPAQPALQKLLPSAPDVKQLPALGDTSVTSPRFIAGRAGIADSRMKYPFDLTDFGKNRANEQVPHIDPNTGKVVLGPPSLLPSEKGEVTNIGPTLAAERTSPNIKDPAQLNPMFRALVPDRLSGTELKPLGIQGMVGDGGEGLPKLEQPSGGRIVSKPIIDKPYNPNNFDVINRGLSGLADAIDSNPQTKGDRPVPDVVNSTPIEPSKSSDIVLPKAGQARPNVRDVGMFQANTSSPNKLLSTYDSTRPIVEQIIGAQDKKLPWINQTLSKAEQFIKGLNNQDLEILGKTLDGVLKPEEVNPDIAKRAMGLRGVLDDIYQQIPPNSRPDNKNVGYLQNYFTHIASDPQQKSLLSYFNIFAKKPELATTGTDSNSSLYENSLGHPNSPYVKTRTDSIDNINYNAKQVIRAYVQSIAKTIYDKPAVDNTTTMLKGVPDTVDGKPSHLKDLATWYIKNYSNYDSEPALHKSWTDFSRQLSNRTARSFLDWNVPLHMLHLGEIPSAVFPELGPKYTAIGIKNLRDNFGEMAQNGLIQNEVIPPSFKTIGEKWQTAAQFFNVVEKLVKGIAYGGAKQKFLDANPGASDEAATMAAINATKDMTYMVDPARQMKGLSEESDLMGGPLASITGNQFRGVPMKIYEQYKNIIKSLVTGPSKDTALKAARLTAGAGLALGGAGLGAHTFHYNINNMISPTMWGPFGSTMKEVVQDAIKGDLSKMIVDTGAWVTPGGQTIKQLTGIK